MTIEQAGHNEVVEAGEIVDLAKQTEDAFLRLYEKYKVADVPEKRKADFFDSLLPEIYEEVFKPDEDMIIFNNQKSKLITWKVIDVESVVNVYVKLCKRYNGVIKFGQFCNMTGLDYTTISLWHKLNKTNQYIFTLTDNEIKEEQCNIYIYNKNKGDFEIYDYSNARCKDRLTKVRFDIIKKLREEMQDSNTNGLSNDTMGHALRANNETELGKLYEPRKMVQQEQIKRALTVEELPKLGNG